ncbi:MAG: hypothetical protein CM15mP120_30550 [Pseudomonadota bacterium]|nr:MAG: hypothetical protein CM15mP120_30550 [Pseudomonadota bacterium]
MVDAEAADAALARPVAGVFHGVPMTEKESYNVAGTPPHLGKPPTGKTTSPRKTPGVKLRAGVTFFKNQSAASLADLKVITKFTAPQKTPYDHEGIPGGSSGVQRTLPRTYRVLKLVDFKRNPAHFFRDLP